MFVFRIGILLIAGARRVFRNGSSCSTVVSFHVAMKFLEVKGIVKFGSVPASNVYTMFKLPI